MIKTFPLFKFLPLQIAIPDGESSQQEWWLPPVEYCWSVFGPQVWAKEQDHTGLSTAENSSVRIYHYHRRVYQIIEIINKLLSNPNSVIIVSSTLSRYSKSYYMLVIRNSPFSSLLVTYKTQRSQPSCSNSIKSCEIMPYSVLLLLLLQPLMMQGRNELEQGDSVLEKLFVDIAAITKHVFVDKKSKKSLHISGYYVK